MNTSEKDIEIIDSVFFYYCFVFLLKYHKISATGRWGYRVFRRLNQCPWDSDVLPYKEQGTNWLGPNRNQKDVLLRLMWSRYNGKKTYAPQYQPERIANEGGKPINTCRYVYTTRPDAPWISLIERDKQLFFRKGFDKGFRLSQPGF